MLIAQAQIGHFGRDRDTACAQIQQIQAESTAHFVQMHAEVD